MQFALVTLENPIEYKLPIIRQTELKEGGYLSYAQGLKSILHQDPDIIFISEIRDEETAKMAFRAAMTGHQVFSTLHTNDCFSTLQRLRELGISASLMADNVSGILAQRLVRKLCNSCKELKVSQPSKDSSSLCGQPLSLAHPTGCLKCNQTGYHGRRPLIEILPIDNTLNSLIASNAPVEKLRTAAKSNTFLSLKQDACQKLFSHETSLSEVNKYVL